MSLETGRVGKQVDLVGIAGGREEDEFVAAGALVGGEVPLDRIGVLGGGADDHPGDLLAQPGVVVAEAANGILFGLLPSEKYASAVVRSSPDRPASDQAALALAAPSA